MKARKQSSRNHDAKTKVEKFSLEESILGHMKLPLTQ